MTRLMEWAQLDGSEWDESIRQVLIQMAEHRILERIWAHDHTVWKCEDTEISSRLGWLHIAQQMSEEVPRLQSLVETVRADGYTHALLLGMGGSSLAPEVFRKTFGVGKGALDLAVLDSTLPGAVLAQAERLDLSRTLFIVSTKSGGTVETLSFFKYFYNRVAETVGADRAGAHFIAITDPGTSLVDLAERYRFRSTFLSEPTIGGRYSALSYFGLVPAALVGVDVPLLLERASCAAHSCEPGVAPPGMNLCVRLGVIMAVMARAGRDKVTLVLSPAIAGFGDWVEQLIAESTGKEGTGVLPVVGESLGTPAEYVGNDRLFVYLRLDGDSTHDEAMRTLEDAGHPVVDLNLQDAYDLGGQCFLWEMATAVAGHLLGINPFDQPNVEAAKGLARQMVAEYQARGTLPDEAPTVTGNGIAVYVPPTTMAEPAADSPEKALAALLDQAQPGDYLALQAYVQPTAATDADLQLLRTRLRDRSNLATTLGYGPRFLHSTGQLHKGDAGNGLFIQITADDARDAPIPDEAGKPEASITFGVLKMAQAIGDRQALLDAGRRVIRFHLQDVATGLQYLADSLV
jgi:glucose-6-phosphate isomerase